MLERIILSTTLQEILAAARRLDMLHAHVKALANDARADLIWTARQGPSRGRRSRRG